MIGDEITSVSVAIATVIFIGDRVVTWMKSTKQNGADAIERLETVRYQERSDSAHRELVSAQARIAVTLDALADKLQKGWCLKEKD